MEIILVGITFLLLGTGFTYLLFQRKHKTVMGLKDQDLTAHRDQIAALQERLTFTQETFTEENKKTESLQNEISELKERASANAASKQYLEQNNSDLAKENSLNKEAIKISQSELSIFKEKVAVLETNIQAMFSAGEKSDVEIKKKTQVLEAKITALQEECKTVSKELIALKEQEPIRMAEHTKNVTTLNQAHQNLERERAKDLAIKEQAETARLQQLRETWSRHEETVEQKMRLVCQRLNIEYIDKEKFPFSGKPDNSVKICGEYIIFDSKSPQGEDLSNFPAYIRVQAEASKKYTKNDEVKNDIFLVVPTNAIQTIKETYIGLGAQRVHVITTDSLSVILMQLQKIEDYDFAEKLSPEDREKIVTVIGKMAHGMKRRVQLDYFMANEFISILTDAENLPDEILEEAQKVEKESKLNPKNEKRAKQIELSDLIKDRQKLLGKVTGQEIHIGPELSSIDAIPLHKVIQDIPQTSQASPNVYIND